MLPTIAIVGRPNVGKSTLFNRITKTRAALVADFPGLTRDRHYGHADCGGHPFILIDTGGFEPVVKSGILKAMASQTKQAIDECDLVIFLTDGRDGVNGHDRDIANLLRRAQKPVILAVNKTEGMESARATAEFYELGLGDPYPISSAHGENVRSLVEMALERLGVLSDAEDEISETEDGGDDDLSLAPNATQTKAVQPSETPERDDAVANAPAIKVAIVGRPNVGKSTLINALLGEDRVIAFDEPGTTRDSIYLDFNYRDRDYVLIDTAGVRKKGKVFEAVEKFSVIKTLQAIDDAHVVVLLLDSKSEIADQDARIASYILEAGRALVIGVNKWERLSDDQKFKINDELDRKLAFLDFAKRVKMSALQKKGMPELMRAVDAAFAAATAKLPTPRLTRLMQDAVAKQQPPRAGGGRPKLRYAHQGGKNPPIIVIHGTALEYVPKNYVRYLEHFFTEAFHLQGTPLRVQFKNSRNPYVRTAVK